MEGGVMVLKYQNTYPGLTKKLYEENRKIYDAAVIMIRVDELNNGAYMHKINKPNWNGTGITFKPCKTKEEWENEYQQLKEEARRINIELERGKGCTDTYRE